MSWGDQRDTPASFIPWILYPKGSFEKALVAFYLQSNQFTLNQKIILVVESPDVAARIQMLAANAKLPMHNVEIIEGPLPEMPPVKLVEPNKPIHFPAVDYVERPRINKMPAHQKQQNRYRQQFHSRKSGRR